MPKIESLETSIEPDSTASSQGIEELDRPASLPPSTAARSQSPCSPHNRDSTSTVDISAQERHTRKLKQAYFELTSTDVVQESGGLSTSRIEQTPGPPGGVYPSPPPVHDPLGPAAQAPYLPAKSEYEGPDLYYSCRPGGPSLFDLLGTLPMEPFGVLEWDILEREEEIYESDEIKVEYKVMHALWLRWITLNR